MNLRPEQRDKVELNITPLIDVVFLLLIFFMVSTTFEHESEINITLPEASKEYLEQKLDSVTIIVNDKEKIFINDIPLINSELMTVREALRDAIRDLNDPAIIINADADTSYQSVIRIMDAARQLSLINITFAVQGYDRRGRVKSL